MRSAKLRLALLLAFTLLVPAQGEWARTAAQENTVTLWTGEATWTHKHEATVNEVKVSWLRTVRMDFTVNNHRMLDPKTLAIFHGLNGSWIFPRGGGTMTVRHEGSPGSEMREVLKDLIDHAGVQMSVKTCAPELSATAAGVPDNTVVLSAVATPRVVWSIPNAGPVSQKLGLVMKIQFPYKHDQTQFNPPEADVPQVAGVGTLPLPAAGLNPPQTPARMSVTLKRKPLELRYEPLDSDQRGDTVFRDWKQVTDHYATATATGGERMVHGNSRIHLLVDGNDASAGFAVSRFLTDWVQPIDQSGRRVGRMKGGGWKLDTERARGGWIDVPGERLAQSPNKWPQERYMQEYLVGVRGFPEFGALYFIVVIDTKPNAYRVRMYPAKRLTIDEWCTIKARKAPYQTEASSGTAVVDSGWKPAR